MQHEQDVGGVTFAELGLGPELCEALTRNRYHEPTALQQAMVGPVLSGYDVLACARRGEGKTLAYLLPVLQQIQRQDKPEALVVTPTRELALQVSTEVRRLLGSKGLRAVALHPGAHVNQQVSLLSKPVHLVSGTPGRLLELIEREALSLKSVHCAVFDELDRLLNSGQLEPMRRIVQELARGTQSIWIAASIDEEIHLLAEKYMIDPTRIGFEQPERRLAGCAHEVVLAPQAEQLVLLVERIRAHLPAAAIVVTSRRNDVGEVARALEDAGLTVLNMREAASRVEGRRRGGRSRQPKKPAQQEAVVWVGAEMVTRAIDLRHVGLLAHFGPPAGIEVYADHVCRLVRLGARLQKVVTLVEASQQRRMEEMLGAAGLEATWHRAEVPEPPAETETVSPEPASPAAAATEQRERTSCPVPLRYKLPVFARPGKEGVPDRLPTKTLGSKFRTARRGMRKDDL